MSRRLLVVDDDPFIRKLIATTLQDVTAFELREATDGAAALALADADPPEVVLLDLDMPGLDGISVCRALRARPRCSATTIVVLTASRGPTVETEVERAGADLLLTKPFSPLELLQLVDRLAGAGPQAGTS